MGKAGKREYVQVLRLLETFEMGHVHGAVRQALDLGTIGYDAVTGTILDRLTHHVHILETNGDSFRLRQSRKAKA